MGAINHRDIKSERSHVLLLTYFKGLYHNNYTKAHQPLTIPNVENSIRFRIVPNKAEYAICADRQVTLVMIVLN
ncbi:hypothetical protein CR513_24305, partial [Mucuna pruriens]